MANTTEQIKEMLSTGLFCDGIKDKHIIINDDMTYIQYDCKNKTKRRLQNPEESVQAKAYLRLIYDYKYLPQNISINESVQMGSETKEADILVYNETNDKILIVVECKEDKINERQFQIAVDQAYSYAHAKAATYVWVTSGIKDEYFEITQVSPVARVSISDIPQRNGKVTYYKYKKGKDEPKPCTQAELMQKFKSAHDALWGGGALAPTTAFDELDKLIFCKIWDEKWRDNNKKSEGEPMAFQIIYYQEDKNDVQNIKAKTELEKRVRELYENGRKKDPEVFKDDIKLDKHKIFTVVKYLQDINISKTSLDAKGLAFQNFMGDFFRGDFGQFFTPNPIVKFIGDSIGIEKDWKVLDTSCGSGGFLLQALKTIRDEANDIYGEEHTGDASFYNYWHEFAEKHLFGIEINEQISRVAKMNMIIHDDGHTNIITNDGLKNNNTIEIENRNVNFQDETFDLIMTNPPFGSSVKANEVNYYKEYELFEKNLGFTETKDRIADDNDKKKWRVSQSTEAMFLERCYKYLKPNGYLAIVVPDGLLTNSTSQYVRDWLVEKFRILAVASLPQHTFAHVNAGVKSSVLFLRKHSLELTIKFEKTLIDIKEKVKSEKGLDKDQRAERMLEMYKEHIYKYSKDYEVLMLDIENIGYDATGKLIDGSELPEASKQIKEFINASK